MILLIVVIAVCVFILLTMVFWKPLTDAYYRRYGHPRHRQRREFTADQALIISCALTAVFALIALVLLFTRSSPDIALKGSSHITITTPTRDIVVNRVHTVTQTQTVTVHAKTPRHKKHG